jgi:Hg(II)-responsive transcriptional regulator
MNSKGSKLTIGRVAGQAGVGIDTIRFYEQRGLLPEPARTAAGYRIYAPDTIHRLNFIRRSKDLGFSLEEISTLLDLQESGGSKTEVRKITERKLADINARIDDLNRMRAVLSDLHAECSGSGDACGCPIIEALADDHLALAGGAKK